MKTNNYLSYYQGLNVLLKPNQNHCEISAQPVGKYLHSFWVKSPAITRGFGRVLKGGFYRSFDLNLNIKQRNVVYFTLVAFFFLVSLALLDSNPTYHQENAGKKIPKKQYKQYKQ